MKICSQADVVLVLVRELLERGREVPAEEAVHGAASGRARDAVPVIVFLK